MSKWETIAKEETGSMGTPGDQYSVTLFALGRHRSDDNQPYRWRVIVCADWGSNQGYRQSDGTRETEGRGESPEEACEAVRKDVFAWCENDEKARAEYATALRNLCYAVEDAEDAN